MPLWRGARLKHRDNSTFTLTHHSKQFSPAPVMSL